MKKISFYLLLVPAAIGPLSGCRTPPPTAAAGDTPDRAAARMAHIAELSRSGETAAARVANEEAYRAYPTNEAVAVRLAMVYLSEERLSDARRIFDELLRANPDAGEARLLRAALRKSMGDAAGALADLAEGAARTGQAEFFAETARLLPAAGETDAALDALRRGVERAAPRRALVSAAAALREQLRREGATNRLDRLQAILDELAERARAEPDTLADLGRLYLMEGDGARAIALLSRARELAPGEATLHTQLALALTSQRRTAEAALTLEDGLRRATDPLPLRRLLAALYRQQAPQDPTALSRAREQIESILAQQPDDAEALERAGQLWLQSGRPLDALARFARLAAVLPDRAAARRGLAAYFAAVGQTAETLAALDRLAAAIPDEPRWAWYRAVVCEAAGDTENALRHYETALRGGDPDGNIALRLVGLLAVADPARGRRTLEDALLRHQKNPRLAVAGGLLEWNDGRPAAAADFFALAQAWIREKGPVSYTHLTLPTIYSV